MSLSKPKKALIGTALLVIITLAIFSHFLTDNTTVDMYGGPLLRKSDTGKLVARSQLDFHHVVEQWVPPKHQGRHIRLKERFIEDGRVIQEDIEYPESENEVKGEPFVDPDQHISNLSLLLIGDENKHMQTEKAHDKSTPSRTVTATTKRKDGELQQPPAEGNERGGLAEHKGSSNRKLTLNNSAEKRDDGLAEHKASSNRNLTSNSSAEKRDDIVIDSQKPSENFKLESKPVGGQSLAEVDSRLKVKTGIHSKTSLSSHGKLSNKTGQVPVAKKPSSTVKRKDEELRQPSAKGNEKGGLVKHKSLSNRNPTLLHSNNSTEKRYDVIDLQKPPGNFKSELKTPIGEQLPAEVDSRVKAETGIQSKPSLSSLWKRSNKTRHRTVAKTSDGGLVKDREVRGAERYAVFDPAKEQAVVAENGGKENLPPGFVRVVSLNSRGQQTVKYVQLSNDQQPKSGHSQSLMSKGNEWSVQYGDKSVNEIDVESDPKYAHLPPSVRKKIAEMRKERQKRLELSKLIREKCEGGTYCLRVRHREHFFHDSCFLSAIKQEKEGVQLNPCRCRLYLPPTVHVDINGRRVAVNTTRPNVALVSLPGSGNTWVRGLLELATGYCTGSMWCDPTLRAMQFCAEGLRSNTLVVKNHDPTIRWSGEKCPENATYLNKFPFNSAIFVHRNPYEANIAEWNRALGSKVHNATKHNQTVAGIGYYDDSDLKDHHTITFGKEAFGLNAGWNATIYTQMENWETMVNHLLINNTGGRPVLLVKYEDLKRDTYDEVKRMVSFLDEEVLPGAEQTLRDGFQTFHRNHTYTFDHYTQEQTEYMNSVIVRVAKQLALNGIDYLHVKKYLREI